jgi:hypothetical protein
MHRDRKGTARRLSPALVCYAPRVCDPRCGGLAVKDRGEVPPLPWEGWGTPKFKHIRASGWKLAPPPKAYKWINAAARKAQKGRFALLQ